MLQLQILLPLFLLVVKPFDCAKLCGRPVELKFTCVKPETESKDLSPIVLLHGLGGDRYTWLTVYQRLINETGRMVCGLDARNHGESPWSEMFNYELMAKDVGNLMDRGQVQKVIVIGHSMGGKTAIVGSFIAPDRVEKLIVEDMRPDYKSPEVVDYLNSIIYIYNDSLKAIPGDYCEDEAKEKTLQYIYARFDAELNPIYKHWTDKVKEKTPGILDCPLGICHFFISLEAALKSYERINADYDGVYRGDTLFIYGKESQMKVGEDEENIRRQFPNSQFVGIEGASHIVHVDKPKEFTDAVVKFINGN